MTFRDYVGFRDRGIPLGPPVGLADLLGDDGRRAVTGLALHGAAIDQYLGEYARCGGLPAPVTDVLTDGVVQPGTIMELWRGLSADVRRLDRSEERLAKLVARTVVSLGHLTNLSDVARDMAVAKATAADYIRLLAASFGVIVLHQRDAKRQGGPSLTLPRKHYFGDPAFAAIPAAQGGPAASIPSLVENVLAIDLFRLVERNALESFAVPQRLFLWRSGRGREIDFIASAGPMDIPIECKYTAEPSGKDYESMSKAFGRGVMASRATLITDRPILTVPVGVLLAALG
jgi:predicted AAA+ superfamily ATPase